MGHLQVLIGQTAFLRTVINCRPALRCLLASQLHLRGSWSDGFGLTKSMLGKTLTLNSIQLLCMSGCADQTAESALLSTDTGTYISQMRW